MNFLLLDQIKRDEPHRDLSRLEEELEIVDVELRSDFAWFRYLDEARRCALLRLGLHMSTKKLLEYHRIMGGVRDGKYDDAATALMCTDWAKSYKTSRFIARQLASGTWQ